MLRFARAITLLLGGMFVVAASAQEVAVPVGRDPGADYFADTTPDPELAKGTLAQKVSARVSDATDSVNDAIAENYGTATEAVLSASPAAQCDAKKMAALCGAGSEIRMSTPT